MDDPDDHVVVFDVGHGVAARVEAPEEHLVHKESLDLVLDEPRDLSRAKFGGVALPGEPVVATVGHCEQNLLPEKLGGEFGDVPLYDLPHDLFGQALEVYNAVKAVPKFRGEGSLQRLVDGVPLDRLP